MRPATTKLGFVLLIGLFTACTKVELADGGEVVARDAQPIADGSRAADARVRLDAPGCMTGVFGTSTFGNACFGD